MQSFRDLVYVPNFIVHLVFSNSLHCTGTSFCESLVDYILSFVCLQGSRLGFGELRLGEGLGPLQ